MTFDESKLHIISNALRVAAEEFARNVEVLSQPNVYGAEMLVPQFQRQARECREIYQQIAEETGLAN